MPGLDITPEVVTGRQVIQSYGAGRFRIAGEVHDGSVLVFPDRTVAWPVSVVEDIAAQSLLSMLQEDKPDILLIGCGAEHCPPPVALGPLLAEKGIVLEWMNTGAACRTFNVILSEERRVAAALVAVD